MNTETLKINITQRILNLNSNAILSKIEQLLNEENVIGYDVNGYEILEKDYISDIKDALQSFENGNLDTYTSEEVKKKILG